MRKTQCHLHLIINLVKEDKKQSPKHQQQSEAYITNNQYEQPIIISNDINNQTKDRTNTEKQTGDIINIGKSCIDLGVKEVVISSILPKKNIALRMNGFGFISNDNISRTHLWKDGIHLEDLGTNILAGNFVDFLNRFNNFRCFSEHS